MAGTDDNEDSETTKVMRVVGRFSSIVGEIPCKCLMLEELGVQA